MSVMEAVNLKNNTIAELEKLVESYPWFAAARKELFLRMSAMGEEYRRDALNRTVLYIYPDYSAFREAYVLSSAAEVDEGVYEEAVSAVSADAGLSVTVSEVEAEEQTAGPEPERKRIYVVGGDYFMPDDLRDVQGQDLSSLDSSRKSQVSSDSSEFTDEAFYTETLARIYADQELYDRYVHSNFNFDNHCEPSAHFRGSDSEFQGWRTRSQFRSRQPDIRCASDS